ncbi:MAG: SMC-Scp complex subunit ScpB [Candidatus Rickettsiella isopodorum]|jgi:segregation and condensation protein B|nr:SMC-Scp complex subunit ScpB [Gammaproteobacteria bacterium]MCH9754691.1 SMC-Scp complex subunit ScpB [Gammaproteobacteria bacterium]MDD5161806.1 SMC-Scp complex subunit ScpB [Candidatus Rickettsiella isopodorum]MDQ5900312.1 SMC-Scp complex subunit ScpB [Pseudomonadota bacterium]
MENQRLKSICEAAILAAGEPVSLKRLLDLFTEEERPNTSTLKKTLLNLAEDYHDRGIQLKQLASGYCFQTASPLNVWVKRLWPEKPPRYSRAFLETLSIIAYKQPVTRGDIEAIRGVAVNPNMIKTLLEQEWIQVVGQREVPGRPNLYATSTLFLDHFGLKELAELPPFPLPGMSESPERPHVADNESKASLDVLDN